MWNLRWQVAGYVQARPAATVEDLEARFVGGSSIRGANLRRACVDNSWDTQQEQFAKFLLIDLCAIYEGWLGAALDAVRGSEADLKDLQFPTSHTLSGKKVGVSAALGRLHKNESALIVSALYPALRRHAKNSRNKLETILACYRYFKELRNVLIHGGGRASEKLLEAHAVYVSIGAATDLDLKEIPAHHPPVLGFPVKLSLRGVVGFSGLLIRLVTTLDAELARTQPAEELLARRLAESLGKGKLLPPKGTSQRRGRIRACLRNLGLPFEGVDLKLIDAWSTRRKLVS